MTYYVVTNMNTGDQTLVEADNKNQAFRFVGETVLSVELAQPTKLVQMLEDGATVLRRTESQKELALEESVNVK